MHGFIIIIKPEQYLKLVSCAYIRFAYLLSQSCVEQSATVASTVV